MHAATDGMNCIERQELDKGEVHGLPVTRFLHVMTISL